VVQFRKHLWAHTDAKTQPGACRSRIPGVKEEPGSTRQYRHAPDRTGIESCRRTVDGGASIAGLLICETWGLTPSVPSPRSMRRSASAQAVRAQSGELNLGSASPPDLPSRGLDNQQPLPCSVAARLSFMVVQQVGGGGGSNPPRELCPKDLHRIVTIL